MSTSFAKTEVNRVKRLPDRGKYDQETIFSILDQTMICHVGFVQDGQPFVIPTLHARRADQLLLHGATTSRMIQHIQAGHPVCITATLVDGLVLAKSVFHHSINYRSAVVFGTGTLVDEPEAKMNALAAFTDKLVPGRWADARQPNAQEFKATAVVAIQISSASAKMRSGSPKDDVEDYDLPIWSGVVPARQVLGEPQPDDHTAMALPDYLAAWLEQNNQ